MVSSTWSMLLYPCLWLLLLLLLLCEEGGPQGLLSRRRNTGKCSECFFINICSDFKKTQNSVKLGVYSVKQ